MIEGERVLSPLPQAARTAVIENWEELLKRDLDRSEWRAVRESGWRCHLIDGKDSVPGPDLMVNRKPDYENSTRLKGWFEGEPILVTEVISPSERKYRRLEKISLYIEAGAKAVVEIDYTKRIVLIYRPEDDPVELIREGRITWPFEANLSEIFERL